MSDERKRGFASTECRESQQKRGFIEDGSGLAGSGNQAGTWLGPRVVLLDPFKKNDDDGTQNQRWATEVLSDHQISRGRRRRSFSIVRLKLSDTNCPHQTRFNRRFPDMPLLSNYAGSPFKLR